MNEKIINRIFALMMARYTHKWTSQFAADTDMKLAKSVWADGLSGLANDQIKQALDMCIDEYPSWPPTLGEFKALCKVGEQTRNELLSLPKPVLSKEKRNEQADKFMSQLDITRPI
jgi:hypothetical protein